MACPLACIGGCRGACRRRLVAWLVRSTRLLACTASLVALVLRLHLWRFDRLEEWPYDSCSEERRFKGLYACTALEGCRLLGVALDVATAGRRLSLRPLVGGCRLYDCSEEACCGAWTAGRLVDALVQLVVLGVDGLLVVLAVWHYDRSLCCRGSCDNTMSTARRLSL
jgi:hypothetical protein